MIQANEVEKETHKQGCKKITRAFWKTVNIHIKACLLFNTKGDITTMS